MAKLLKELQIHDKISVNTVDGFQGQEKDIIILSTVRASADPGDQAKDRDRLLGFVVDERRMNVSITRARFVLIVIGNSLTLSVDENWEKYISYAHSLGGYYSVEN